MLDIRLENQEIENSIKEIARYLLREKKVDIIIGYSNGTVPLSTMPIFVRNEIDIDKLVWNNLCYANLAKYLSPRVLQLKDPDGNNLKVGIVAKGCVGRALIHLIVEKQINLNEIKIIGIHCNGIINRKRIEKEIEEKEILEYFILNENIVIKGRNFEQKFPFHEYLNELCKTCKIRSPPKSSPLLDVIIGESQETTFLEDDYKEIIEFDAKSPNEKGIYIKDLLENCIRCYACREACPMCYCNLCFVDQNKPIWFGKTTELSDIIVFHLVRAIHLAGRCVSCGACSSVCPMGIDLHFITRKLEKIVKERYNFTSGLNLETLPPMMSFSMEDEQEFMLDED